MSEFETSVDPAAAAAPQIATEASAAAGAAPGTSPASPAPRKPLLNAEPAATPAAPEPKTDATGAIIPEKYEFTMPEGVQLDGGLLDKTTPILKELGLSQEQATKLVGAYADHVKAQAEAAINKDIEDHNQRIDAWDAELKQTFGDKLPQTISDAQIALNQLDSPELMELLESSGLGSHPGVIKQLAKLGSQMRERETVNGGTTPQESNSWGFVNR